MAAIHDGPEPDLRRRVHLAMAAPMILALASDAPQAFGASPVLDFSVTAATAACAVVAIGGWVLAFILPGLGRYARAEAEVQRVKVRPPKRAAGPVAHGLLAVAVPVVTGAFLVVNAARLVTVRWGAASVEDARVAWKQVRTGKGCRTELGVRGERGTVVLLCLSPDRWERLSMGQPLRLAHRAGPWGDAVVAITRPDGRPF